MEALANLSVQIQERIHLKDFSTIEKAFKYFEATLFEFTLDGIKISGILPGADHNHEQRPVWLKIKENRLHGGPVILQLLVDGEIHNCLHYKKPFLSSFWRSRKCYSFITSDGKKSFDGVYFLNDPIYSDAWL